MIATKNETCTFRHRGYVMKDPTGATVPGVDTLMIFGDGPAPLNDPAAPGTWVRQWSHIVTEVVTVVDDPTPDAPVSVPAPTPAPLPVEADQGPTQA